MKLKLRNKFHLVKRQHRKRVAYGEAPRPVANGVGKLDWEAQRHLFVLCVG